MKADSISKLFENCFFFWLKIEKVNIDLFPQMTSKRISLHIEFCRFKRRKKGYLSNSKLGSFVYFWEWFGNPKIIFRWPHIKFWDILTIICSAPWNLSPVLGGNSQNFLRKFIIFFFNFKLLLQSNYPLKISSFCFIQ